jgi:murein DD-endopeptidase MepM/ murein hydrolase activator NlpD
VKAGEKVKRGDVIGLVGKSGKALGPHLHYEVRVNDKPVNPYNYILEE